MSKTENKPIIAVDVDEVIFPFVDDLIEYVDRQHSVKLSREEFVTYSLADIWKGGPHEGAEVIKAYVDQQGIEVAPVKGAAEALGQLCAKYEVVIITARDLDVQDKTKNWAYRHFPDIFKEIHLVGNQKDSVSYREKAEVCKELGVFCLIDDSLKPVVQTHAAGIKSILFGNYPWNKMEELPAGIDRVEDWKGVLKILL